MSENKHDCNLERLGRMEQTFVSFISDPPIRVNNHSRGSSQLIGGKAFLDRFAQGVHLPPEEVGMEFLRGTMVYYKWVDCRAISTVAIAAANVPVHR